MTPLCNACAKISFKPLRQTGYSFRKDADPTVVREHEHRLFYFHHCCLACVNKASIDGCRLCALFLARIKVPVNIILDDKLGAALELPGAGVWVVLTQRPGDVVTARDGRTFSAPSQQTNWGSELTFHYEKLAARVELEMLPSNLVDDFRRYPFRPLPGRRFEDSAVGLASSVGIARAWFETCHDKDWGHVSCRPFGTEPQTLPTRVIDVGTVSDPKARIFVTNGAKGQYLTLSYCWGKPQKIRLFRKTQNVFQLALPLQDISKTIQDAVVFTRELGFRYLWVDALCIIQDDSGDMNRQFKIMGDIYKNSALTLAAAVGDNADSGLFVHRDPLPRRPCPLYEKNGPKGNHLTTFAILPSDPIIETPLDSRGWVFQEDMLATRTLKFGPDGLRWSCASFWMSESTPRMQLHPSGRPHTTFREWIHQPDWKPNWHEALDPERHFFEDWYEAVSSYTDRELTKPSDRLPALAGLAQWMRTLKGCTYVQGLWEEDLEYGLLWYVGTPLQADRMSDMIRGDEHYRFVPASGSGGASRAVTNLKPAAKKKVDFIRQSELSPDEELWLVLNFLSCQDRHETATSVPSWSWASLPTASIRFLYSPVGLSAQGTPMATCLRVKYNKGARRNSFVAAQGGHMVLKGAVSKVTVVPGERRSDQFEYEPTSMCRGRWVASLLTMGLVVGYAALDEDPITSGIAGKEMSVLLMRDDTKTPSFHERLTPSGYLKKESHIPLSLARNSAGLIVKNGDRRYTTALLLQRSRGDNSEVYQRVGLCQIYHFVWDKELRDPSRRNRTVVVI